MYNTCASTANTFYLKAGDQLPELRAVLVDGAGVPINLGTGDLVYMRYRLYMDTGYATEVTASIVEPDAPPDSPDVGAVIYVLPPGSTIPSGTYEVEWRVLFVGGYEETFPNRGYDVLYVGSRLPVAIA